MTDKSKHSVSHLHIKLYKPEKATQCTYLKLLLKETFMINYIKFKQFIIWCHNTSTL